MAEDAEDAEEASEAAEVDEDKHDEDEDEDDKEFRARVIAASDGYPALQGYNSRSMWLQYVEFQLGINFKKSKRHVFEDDNHAIEREIQWGNPKDFSG